MLCTLRFVCTYTQYIHAHMRANTDIDTRRTVNSPGAITAEQPRKKGGKNAPRYVCMCAVWVNEYCMRDEGSPRTLKSC